MRALGFDPTDAEVQKMAAEAGHKDSSAITFEEFVEMVGKKYVSAGASSMKLRRQGKLWCVIALYSFSCAE